ncbi:MAG TPA: DUF4129 domain-containing protein [Cyclobacteriaceae bacterium]|nr:DUF4129 domain-containing protein [Cyclobacteriaceae bacterium]
MRFTLPIFIWLLVLLPPTFVCAQDADVHYDSTEYYNYEKEDDIVYHAPNDTTKIIAKKFAKEKITSLKLDKDFDYKEPPTMAESIWDRFWQWIGRFINTLFEGATSTNWGRVLVYVAAFVGFMVILLMILRVNAFRILYSGADRGSITTNVFHENIHEMDFDKLIQDALTQQKYREGIRLVFLQSLKLLTDKQYIHWHAGKTNHDYVDELNSGELKANFNELSFYFDYAWYGNFPIREEAFTKTQQLFHSLKEKTSNR